jgi:SAM-dependent methyltransferase
VHEPEFTDARLVAVYDALNPYEPGTQPDFYAQLAAEIGASNIIELGCGTGLVTSTLADRGYDMIGVDPSPAMLAVARARDDRVRWAVGGPDAIRAVGADLTFMSGHVAQFFVTDAEWADALDALHTALRPGGVLAFETRNPDACEWEQWTRASRRVVNTSAGRVEQWSEVDDVRDRVVAYRNHYRFAATGDEIVSPCRLRFRNVDELHASLARAGFAIDVVYGDWDRRPVTRAAPELIVVASR